MYVHQPSSADELTDGGWREDQYAVHWWVQRALQSYPWRVQSPAEADVIYFNSSLTYGDGRFSLRRVGVQQNPLGSAVQELTHQIGLMYPEGSDSALRRCGAVWFATSFNQRYGKHTKIRPSPCIRFVREVMWGAGEFGLPLVAPFVVASPSWLTSDTSSARRKLVPWAERKLLFFAGHMPQLHISNVRWNLWRELQGDPRATLVSPDVITLARYARVCDNFLRGPGFIGNTTFALPGVHAGMLPPVSDIYDFMMADCVALCKAHGEVFLEGCGDSKLSPEQACDANDVHTIRKIIRENSTRAVFSKCAILAAHRVPAVVREAPPRQLDPVRLSRELYLEEMMRHKFCVIAAGDDMSTHKIGETMTVASRGGCLPLIVGNLDVSLHPVPHFAYLPHTESVDYCRVGFIVPLVRGRRVPAFKQMLAALESVTTSEWRERRRAAEQLRSWFVFRDGSTEGGGASSAADHIISRMCQMAAQLRRTLPSTLLSLGFANKTTARQATPQMCPPHSEALAEWQRSSAKDMRLRDAWFRGHAAPE